MTPDPFREALDALETTVHILAQGSYMGTESLVHYTQEYHTARREVERLYAARVGEEYEVAFIQPDCGDPTVPEYRAEWGMVLHGTMPVWLHPDQRVRVSRIPAGDMTGEAP